MSEKLLQLAQEIGIALQQRGLKCVTAESCTAGGIAYWITSISGSSAWFDKGWVTYNNTAKQELLGVSADILDKYTAVSEETALAMAQGALARSTAHISIAITGIAGPTGGTPGIPVGTVWIAFATHNKTQATHYVFKGSRQQIREEAIQAALSSLIAFITDL